MGARSQRKGRAAEFELARIFQDHGIPAQVGDPLNYGTQPDIVGVPGVHVECKRTEHLRLSEWLEQATKDAQRFHDGAPTIFWRKSRSPWLVIMSLTDWLALYEAAQRADG